MLLPMWPDSPAPGLSLSPHSPGNGQLALLTSSGTILVWKYPRGCRAEAAGLRSCTKLWWRVSGSPQTASPGCDPAQSTQELCQLSASWVTVAGKGLTRGSNPPPKAGPSLESSAGALSAGSVHFPSTACASFAAKPHSCAALVVEGVSRDRGTRLKCPCPWDHSRGARLSTNIWPQTCHDVLHLPEEQSSEH